MSNMKFLKPLLFLATVSVMAAPACRLSPPKAQEEGEGGVAACIEDPEIPAEVDADAGVGRRWRGRR